MAKRGKMTCYESVRPYARSLEKFHAISRERHLEGAVRLTRLFGILFLLVGALLVFLESLNSFRPRLYALAMISALVVIPGILFLFTSIFLKKRRYWAWIIATAMTVLILIVVVLLSVTAMFVLSRGADVDVLWIPATALSCLAIALSFILFSLRRCRPAILEGDQLAQHGFAVIPVARVAPNADAKLPPGQSTSPYSSPPDPSPPHKPPPP